MKPNYLSYCDFTLYSYALFCAFLHGLSAMLFAYTTVWILLWMFLLVGFLIATLWKRKLSALTEGEASFHKPFEKVGSLCWWLQVLSLIGFAANQFVFTISDPTIFDQREQIFDLLIGLSTSLLVVGVVAAIFKCWMEKLLYSLHFKDWTYTSKSHTPPSHISGKHRHPAIWLA